MCRYYGSPPRLWGIRDDRRCRDRSPTVHPHACGEYAPGLGWRPLQTVHPHACGEYWPATASLCCSVAGSPPRLWGIHGITDVAQNAARFTPTPVGNTVPDRWRRLPSVHPHACGEYDQRNLIGRCGAVHPHACGEYITPSVSRLTATATVHPHACGEYCGHALPEPIRCRFTPTPVGNTVSALCIRRMERFTPTPVGNT